MRVLSELGHGYESFSQRVSRVMRVLSELGHGYESLSQLVSRGMRVLSGLWHGYESFSQRALSRGVILQGVTLMKDHGTRWKPWERGRFEKQKSRLHNKSAPEARSKAHSCDFGCRTTK